MKSSFIGLVKDLRSLSNQFDHVSDQNKKLHLKELSRQPLPEKQTLIEYVDLLMFLIAHPSNEILLSLAEKELSRVTSFLKKMSSQKRISFFNSGLPFAEISTQFSHDFSCWLMQQKDCTVSFEAWNEGTTPLIEVLKLTLPSVELEYTSTGSANEELLDALLVKKEKRFEFILSQLSNLNAKPMIKDHLFDSLMLTESVIPKSASFSRPYNRLKNVNSFFHHDVLKKFDHIALLNTALPNERKMEEQERREVSDVIRRSMALMARETDPATFIDLNSLILFDLERGISVAIFGMTPERQLPLESYLGFTLFKNGFPMSYGGAWVFGRRALFGINIFEAFRGGESGYVMCQLLRVYRQAFGVDYFEVEPYQYGADNPDGIKSGAFWFYYRYGFRPLDAKLAKLADAEFQKIKTKPGYRSSEKTLLRFTESNIAMNLGKGIPVTVSELVLKITKLIQTRFKGDRLLAEQVLIGDFIAKTGLDTTLSADEKRVLSEVAFLAGVIHPDKKRYEVLKKMIATKANHVVTYQSLILDLF